MYKNIIKLMEKSRMNKTYTFLKKTGSASHNSFLSVQWGSDRNCICPHSALNSGTELWKSSLCLLTSRHGRNFLLFLDYTRDWHFLFTLKRFLPQFWWLTASCGIHSLCISFSERPAQPTTLRLSLSSSLLSHILHWTLTLLFWGT